MKTSGHGRKRNSDMRQVYRNHFPMVSYVGNGDDEIDYQCAGEHGTTVILEWEVSDGIGIGVLYTNQGSFQIEAETMTLLIPDRDRDNREDFIWCIPVERQKWNKWYALSEQFKTVTPEAHGAVRYMNRMEGKQVRTVLIMPNASQTDDDAVTACAYLRMIKGLTCRMYVVRCTDDPLSGARLIERVVGADITMVEDVEEEKEDEPKQAT